MKKNRNIQCTGDKDKHRIDRVLSHPSVFEPARDDGILTSEGFAHTILVDPRYICLMPHKNTVFLFWPINCITFEMHAAIIAGPTRARGVKHALTAVKWLLENTKCQKLITYIPEDNPPAMTFASLCGMTEEGRVSDSWMKDGKLGGIVLYGATRQKFDEMYPEVEQ